ncbi:MAG TPA: VWA domain-containing protein [Pyrinomonadaceae bacterium]
MNLRRKSLISSLILCALSALATAQKPESDVVKISTSLVRIDVTATDKDGKTIRGLKPEDLEVFENGNRQKIVSLTFVSPTAAPQSNQGVANDPASGSSANAVNPAAIPKATPVVTRRMVIAIDDYTMSAESIQSTRKALKQYLDANFRPGDAIAIVVLSKVQESVVRFYLKRELLDDAVNRIGWYSGGTSEAADIPPTDTDLVGAGSANSWRVPEMRQISRLLKLLGAIKVVPGRVPVILFSDGFVLPPEPSVDDLRRDGLNREGVLQPLEKLIDTANRQATTIYTIDARGLLVSGLRASDMMPENLNISDPTGKNMGASAQKALQDTLRLRKERMDQISLPQDTLDMIAKRTGGIAYRNRNDLDTALAEAADDGGYYLLAYEPSAEDFDPKVLKMNTIRLTTSRKGVQLRYRTAFANRQ